MTCDVCDDIFFSGESNSCLLYCIVLSYIGRGILMTWLVLFLSITGKSKSIGALLYVLLPPFRVSVVCHEDVPAEIMDWSWIIKIYEMKYDRSTINTEAERRKNVERSVEFVLHL